MSEVYTIQYRWRGRSFHTVVAGADRREAVAAFRREFPHIVVEDEFGAAKVTGVRRLVLGVGVEERVLQVLPGLMPISCAVLGDRLWGRCARQPQHWCRPAGRVLRRMERAGLVRQVRVGRRWLWQAVRVEVRYG